jgi:type I restriction enzyme S subunit
LEALAETLFVQYFINEADESWELKKISDVALINQSSIDKNFQYSQIEYLDTGSITENRISEFQKLNLNQAPSRAQRLVKPNDIIYSLVRPIQKHYGFLKEPKPNTVVSTGFCVLTCNNIEPHFIYLLLTRNEMTDYLDMIAEGSTSAYPSLKPSDIANIEFQQPPQNVLNIFSVQITPIWKKLYANTEQINSLKNLRDTLLQKLMSGEATINN